MDFDRDWHTFSLDAEVDAYGTSRIAGAHNRLREENARLRARLARVVEAGGHLRGFAAGTDLGKAYIATWDAALAAAKGE